MSTLISIISWNCWLLRFPRLGAPDVSRRRDLIAQTLSDSDADVVALQEVWHPFDQRRLQKSLSARGYSFFHYDRRNYGSGLFLASKHKIIDSAFSRHSARARDAERFLGKGVNRHRLDVGGSMLTFVNVHLGAEVAEEDRLKDLQRLLTAAEQIRTDSVFLAGDFNFGRDSKGYAQVMKHGYRDSHIGLPAADKPTLEAENPHVTGAWRNKTVDFIFTKGASVLDASTVGSFRKTGIFFSDHTGLRANIVI